MSVGLMFGVIKVHSLCAAQLAWASKSTCTMTARIILPQVLSSHNACTMSAVLQQYNSRLCEPGVMGYWHELTKSMHHEYWHAVLVSVQATEFWGKTWTFHNTCKMHAELQMSSKLVHHEFRIIHMILTNSMQHACWLSGLIMAHQSHDKCWIIIPLNLTKNMHFFCKRYVSSEHMYSQCRATGLHSQNTCKWVLAHCFNND